VSNERIFNGPDHFDDSTATWTDTHSRDFHVVVFFDHTDLLFVPQYNNVNILHEAFDDAFAHGSKQVEAATWDGFKIEYHQDHNMAWPCVRLVPKYDS
jgi:hypothetical protein